MTRERFPKRELTPEEFASIHSCSPTEAATLAEEYRATVPDCSNPLAICSTILKETKGDTIPVLKGRLSRIRQEKQPSKPTQ